MIAALILAGSHARRPDGPIALRPFPDVPLVAVQWLALRGAGLDPLRIAVGGPVAAVARGSGLARENFVGVPGSSPGALLRRGLGALLDADDWDAVVIQPVQAFPPHPAVVVALVERVVAGGMLAAVPAHRGRTGFPVVLARDVALELARPGRRGASLEAALQGLEKAGAAERVEAYTGDVLRDLGDPATWRRALRDVRKGGG
jgi:CTP:molybdopterin cytidylyltransferase MocA